jgi:hypothetical protein
MGSGLASQEAAGQQCRRFWKRTELFFWSKPRLLAGYPDPLLTLYTTETVIQTLPHAEHECQQSINDFQLYNLGYLCSNWLKIFINEILVAISGTNHNGTLPAPS